MAYPLSKKLSKYNTANTGILDDKLALAAGRTASCSQSNVHLPQRLLLIDLREVDTGTVPVGNMLFVSDCVENCFRVPSVVGIVLFVDCELFALFEGRVGFRVGAAGGVPF